MPGAYVDEAIAAALEVANSPVCLAPCLVTPGPAGHAAEVGLTKPLHIAEYTPPPALTMRSQLDLSFLLLSGMVSLGPTLNSMQN